LFIVWGAIDMPAGGWDAASSPQAQATKQERKLSPEQQLVGAHYQAFDKLDHESQRLYEEGKELFRRVSSNGIQQAELIAATTSLSDGYRRLEMRVDDLDPLSDGALKAFNDSFRKMAHANSTHLALTAEFVRRCGGDNQALSTSLRWIERGLRIAAGDPANPIADTVAEFKDLDELTKQMDEASATLARANMDLKREREAYVERFNRLFN
jgi:hypothetical protein